MIQVADLVEWEKGSLDHAELFRQQTIEGHYEYTVIEQYNRVVLCADVSDVDTFFEVLETAAAEDAKDLDGVRRDTIQFLVLDKGIAFWLPGGCARFVPPMGPSSTIEPSGLDDGVYFCGVSGMPAIVHLR